MFWENFDFENNRIPEDLQQDFPKEIVGTTVLVESFFPYYRISCWIFGRQHAVLAEGAINLMECLCKIAEELPRSSYGDWLERIITKNW